MRITVQVKPGSSKGPLVVVNDDSTLTIFLKQRAVDGAANEALIKVLAEHFEVAKSKVSIESGFTGRLKRVSIEK